MADDRMIARLADLPEFAELQKLFEDAKATHLQWLANRFYEDPDGPKEHEMRLKTLRLRGIEEWLKKPAQMKAKLEKEKDD